MNNLATLKKEKTSTIISNEVLTNQRKKQCWKSFQMTFQQKFDNNAFNKVDWDLWETSLMNNKRTNTS